MIHKNEYLGKSLGIVKLVQDGNIYTLFSSKQGYLYLGSNYNYANSLFWEKKHNYEKFL